MSNLPISTIIPTYNRTRYLGEAIESVLNQSAPPAELIVLDDGSSEDVQSVTTRYGDRLLYVRKENGGKAAALNLALSLTKHKYIHIFDDDDVCCRDGLAHLYAALSSRPSAGWAYGMCDRFDDDWQGITSEPYPHYYTSDHAALRVRTLEDFFIWQGAMLVRRELYSTVGPFDITLTRSQDYEMLLRLSRRHPSVAVPEIIFHQRHHSGVRGSSKDQLSTKRDIEKAWDGFNKRIYRSVYQNYRLDEYVVDWSGGKERSTATGYIHRASIMARMSLWQEAASDLISAGEILSAAGETCLNRQEQYALRRLFEPNARSRFESWRQARRFFDSLNGFSPAIAKQVQGSLFHYIPYRLRHVQASVDKTRELQQLIILAFFLAGPKSALTYLRARREMRNDYSITEVAVQPRTPAV